jgi:hypothetical protein
VYILFTCNKQVIFFWSVRTGKLILRCTHRTLSQLPLDINHTDNLRRTYKWGALVQSLLQWKSNKYYIFWVCVCSLIYPACKAHDPYDIVISDLSGSTIFFHIISQTARLLEKKVIEHNIRVLILSKIYVRKISHSEKNWARYHKYS